MALVPCFLITKIAIPSTHVHVTVSPITPTTIIVINNHSGRARSGELVGVCVTCTVDGAIGGVLLAVVCSILDGVGMLSTDVGREVGQGKSAAY